MEKVNLYFLFLIVFTSMTIEVKASFIQNKTIRHTRLFTSGLKGKVLGDSKKVALPDEFKSSQVERFTTEEGNLYITAFNKETKTCLAYTRWHKEKYSFLSKEMSHTECRRFRVSRCGKKDKRFYSYASDEGKFHWLPLLIT